MATPVDKMTGPLLVRRLHTLVEIGHRMHQVELQISQTTTEIKSTTLAIKKGKDSISSMERELINARKEADERELEVQTLREQENKRRKMLDNESNQKVYRTLQREIDALRKQSLEYEDSLVETWQHVDLLEKGLTKERTTAANQIEKLEEAIKNAESALIKLKEDLVVLEQEKTEKALLLPPEWLARYNRMHNSVADPVVAVSTPTCSACYYSIIPHEFAQLKKGEVLLCKSCYRFLYYSENGTKAQ